MKHETNDQEYLETVSTDDTAQGCSSQADVQPIIAISLQLTWPCHTFLVPAVYGTRQSAVSIWPCCDYV